MKVVLAESMGFCFGVRDAITVATGVERPEQVTIHGELVHNEAVLHDLDVRGFRRQDEAARDSLPESTHVLVTAHGISDRGRRRLEAAGKRLIDTTCPLVRRAHRAATTLAAEGRHVIVLGRRGHVEVRGLTGDLSDYSIVEGPADVRTWTHDRLGVVCQTTTPPALAEQLHEEIRAKNPHADLRFVNTVCQPTIDRQLAMDRLLPQVDVVVVIGGSNSNNTARLAELSRNGGVPAFHVQQADDVAADWFAGCSVVGVTAGTSTPDDTIRQVTEVVERIEPPADSLGGPWSSARWCHHFRRNAERVRPIPWETAKHLSDRERRAVGRSVAIFQLGESGEGTHLLRCARSHSRDVGDPNYVPAITWFIREEQRHAAMLGRFLDEAGVPRLSRTWTDGVFRRLRHAAGLELTITVLVTAEMLAKVYYAALRDATACGALQALCRQILCDEVAHVRFQCERIELLQRHNRSWVRRGKRVLHAVLLAGAACVLWVTHRSVFRAAGLGPLSYCRRVRRTFRMERGGRPRPSAPSGSASVGTRTRDEELDASRTAYFPMR